MLSTIVGFLIPTVELCGAVVVAIGVLRALVLYLISLFRTRWMRVSTLRVQLGQSMVMGLEFQVAADILKTALAPNWNDILLLASLIALRTVLNYLLEFEIRSLNAEKPSVSSETP